MENTLDQLKKSIADLTSRKAKLEKEVTIHNANYNTHLEILKKDFNISKVEDVDAEIAASQSKADELEAKIKTSIEQMRVHIQNLEVLIRGS